MCVLISKDQPTGCPGTHCSVERGRLPGGPQSTRLQYRPQQIAIGQSEGVPPLNGLSFPWHVVSGVRETCFHNLCVFSCFLKLFTARRPRPTHPAAETDAFRCQHCAQTIFRGVKLLLFWAPQCMPLPAAPPPAHRPRPTHPAAFDAKLCTKTMVLSCFCFWRLHACRHRLRRHYC